MTTFHSTEQQNSDAGFTLIELLIAFAILSVALVSLLGVFSTNLHRAKTSEMQDAAVSHLQSLLANAGVEQPLKPGLTQGVFPDGQTWQIEVSPSPYGHSERLAAYIIVATVSWPGKGEDKASLSLKTLKLVEVVR